MTRRALFAGEAARMLGITADTLARKARVGSVPAHKVGGRWRYPAHQIRLMVRVGPAWLTSTQAARAANRSTKTINAWADRGLLPCRRGRGGWRWFNRLDVVRLTNELNGRRRAPRKWEGIVSGSASARKGKSSGTYLDSEGEMP
jgi:excisionase family DNA binding protein